MMVEKGRWNRVMARIPRRECTFWTYDAEGRQTRKTYADSTHWDYTYDAAGRLASRTDAQSQTTVYQYDAVGNLININYPNDPNVSFTYDALNRKVQIAAGRRTVRIDGAATPPSRTNLFGYNLRSELVDAIMGTNSYAYAYDPIGNRREASANEVANLYQVNELNQYTNVVVGAVEPVYDADGNLIQLGPWVYSWDGENRLVSVASNGVPVMQNQYDYMSRRIMKATATQTNTFRYDGWNMVQESTVSGLQSHVSHFVWGLDLSGTLQGAGGVGGLLMQSRADAESPWFHFCDANGNVTDLVDADGNVVAHYACDANGNVTDVLDKDGALAAHFEYDGFGNAIAQSGDQADANPFRFSSKYRDGETGLYYYGYRFYSPGMGRWVSRDPVGEEGGLNLCSFAFNSPLDRFDSLGLITFSGCKPDQEKKIKDAFDSYCKKIKDDEAEFKKCLKCNDKLVDKLKKDCDGAKLQVVCEPEGGDCTDTCGYSHPWTDTIHVCQDAFDDPGCGPLGCTLFHEITHSHGGWTEKWSCNVEKCLNCPPSGSCP